MEQDRISQMLAIANEKYWGKYEQYVNGIQAEIQEKYTDTIYYEELKTAFLASCKTCKEKQENGEKNEIVFVGIHFLKSSMITRSYDLYINFYDERFYADKAETYGIWKPQTIMSYYEEMAKEYEKDIRRNVICPRYSEIQDMKMQLYGDFLKIIEEIVRSYAFSLVNLEEFTILNRAEEHALFFSPYMEIGRPLCTWKKSWTEKERK